MSLIEDLKKGVEIRSSVQSNILILDVERLDGITQQRWWDRGDLQKRYIHHETVVREPRTTIVCAKWYFDDEVIRLAEWDKGGRGRFLKRVHKLVSQADIIVGHNIDRADDPWIKGDLYLPRIGHKHVPNLPPLPPHKTVDTLKVIRSEFKSGAPFKSLDAFCQIAGIPSKTDAYDRDAMERAVTEKSEEDRQRLVDYCAGDVLATEGLFDWLRPHIKYHPTLLSDDPDACNRCGGETEETGRRYLANVMSYELLRCTECGAYSRLRIGGVRETDVQSV